MPVVTEVMIVDADGDEFPIAFGGPVPADTTAIARLALERLRDYAAEGHMRPTEPLSVVSVRER